jgi:hypothetical protein
MRGDWLVIIIESQRNNFSHDGFVDLSDVFEHGNVGVGWISMQLQDPRMNSDLAQCDSLLWINCKHLINQVLKFYRKKLLLKCCKARSNRN